MAMVMDNTITELDFSDFSTITTTTTEDDQLCNWPSDWSPVMDWAALSGDNNDDDDDIHGLIESMMDDDKSGPHQHVLASAIHEGRGYFNPSVELSMEETLTESDDNDDDSKGLRVVHLLIAAAEAMAGGKKSRELAQVILIRLKELVSPTDGTNMERLAAHFTTALQSLLEYACGVPSKHMLTNGAHHHHRDDHHQTEDVLSAFQLLQDMSPYVKFGHFTANQAILEAAGSDRRVHIVDYDVMEGIQWASLMQAFVSRKKGTSVPHLRITIISRSGSGRRSIGTVQETGRRLVAFAVSIGLPFSFHLCRLDSDEMFRPSALKLIKGEALVFNCMLHLPHFNYRAPESVASFLSGAKTLNPRLVTLVEEEVGSTGGDGGFLGRFMDSLHRYSAVYDSLEAGSPMQGPAQTLVERVFLGPQIAGSLTRSTRGAEQSCSWAEWLDAVGFHPLNISFANHCQAKLLLGLFNDGYKVEELANNRLVLGWKSRRILSASIWTSTDS